MDNGHFYACFRHKNHLVPKISLVPVPKLPRDTGILFFIYMTSKIGLLGEINRSSAPAVEKKCPGMEIKPGLPVRQNGSFLSAGSRGPQS
jgi:hypothetical protein